MTMDALQPAMYVAGAAFMAYSAYSQSQASKNAYEYQSAVSRNNAKIAEWNAQDAARRGEQDEINARQKIATATGAQRATLAGRGIDMSEGSALNILTDTAYLGEQDVRTVRDNTAKNVWAARVQASNDRSNSELLAMRADNENPLFSGAASLLTSASSVDPKWFPKFGWGGV